MCILLSRMSWVFLSRYVVESGESLCDVVAVSRECCGMLGR